MSEKRLNIQEFEAIFKEYYSPLCNYINSKINNLENSKEIVQATFHKMWENKDTLIIHSSYKSYLYRSVKNMMIDHIRKSKHIISEDEQVLNNIESEESSQIDTFLVREQIEIAMDSLKEKNREIFYLNKFEGLTYKEIADHLNISERSVEDNMARALKKLREILRKKRHLFEQFMWLSFFVSSLM